MVKENKRRSQVLLGGVPVRQLARELDVSAPYLYQVSRGERPPSKKILDWMKANNRELKIIKKKREGAHTKSGPEERVRQSATYIVRQVVDFMAPDAPPTMKANAQMEPKFINALVELIRERGIYPKELVLTYGAAKAGCAPETAKRYLSKLTTELGPFQEIKDVLGGWMLTFQEGLS